MQQLIEVVFLVQHQLKCLPMSAKCPLRLVYQTQKQLMILQHPAIEAVQTVYFWQNLLVFQIVCCLLLLIHLMFENLHDIVQLQQPQKLIEEQVKQLQTRLLMLSRLYLTQNLYLILYCLNYQVQGTTAQAFQVLSADNYQHYAGNYPCQHLIS